MIDIQGSYFTNLSPIEQQSLIKHLSIISQVNCHRIDLAIDDYTYQQIPRDEMVKAHKQGNSFGYQNFTSIVTDKGKDSDEKTDYFGSKNSEKHVRVYNHKNKCMRFETEFKKDSATSVFNEIANLNQGDKSEDEFSKTIQQTIGGLAVGAIDFRDKSKLKNQKKACKSKTQRLPFYQQFIDRVGANIQVKPERKSNQNEQLESLVNWLFGFASKALAKAYLLYGEGFIWKLIEHGKSKLEDRDRQQIEYWKSHSNHRQSN